MARSPLVPSAELYFIGVPFLMSLNSIAYSNTARTLAAIQQQRSTGELTLGQGDQRWKLYFFHGRLLYATGNIHRTRRWLRAIKRHCPDWQLALPPDGEPWEYDLLSQSLAQQQASVAQAQAVIKASLEEVLFSWVRNPLLNTEWSSHQRFSFNDNAALSLLLSGTEVELVLEQARILWKQWKHLELEVLDPYQSPVLQPTLRADSGNVPKNLANLSPFLTGRYTLWDIATYARRPITTVTRFLLPWIQQGAILLEEIPDLLPPQPAVQAVATSSARYRPLIACVDDSPTVGQFVANILEPAGYRVLKIQDPLLGVATLTQHRPDLILMDLVMPNASGYDLCNFLRKTPVFQNTPIVILTSQGSLVDRTRAKLAGATDFLTKPPDPQALLNLVRSHLQAKRPPERPKPNLGSAWSGETPAGQGC